MVLDKLQRNVQAAALTGLNKAAERVEERLTQNADLTDHTLDDLARLGHPYSRAHPQKIHDPDFLVHTHTGRLRDAIRITRESKDAIAIGVDPVQVPYFTDVVEGNTKMIARDFPFGTLVELIDENIIYDQMEAAIAAAVKKS